MYITNDIKYVGVNDRTQDLFESQYPIPDGMAYNSYVIIDEKIAVLDSVEANFGEEWLKNINEALGGKEPDYLIVQHMEPDHSANIASFTKAYPNAAIVSSSKAFGMMDNFFGKNLSQNKITVTEGDTLDLGEHKLHFITAPMVHWPEVIMTYDAKDKVLFSADAFGKFGANDKEEPWDDEARRYYIGIVGKYGAQVQAVLKKAAALDIQTICSLHGPVLNNNLAHYIDLYDKWSSYTPETDGVVIAYTSIYKNTERAVLMLRDELIANGCKNLAVYDLARCDIFAAVADAFRYTKLVLATTTYNAGIFPPMRSFIEHLIERGFKSRKVGLIENGSWAPMAAKVMRGMLEGCKDVSFTDTSVKIISAPDDTTKEEIKKLADELCEI